MNKQITELSLKLSTTMHGDAHLPTPIMSSIDNANSQVEDLKRVYDEKIRMMTQTELEWMERIDALITCQKFYKNKDA